MTDETGTIRRCLAGDERAYRELVERYRRPVYSVALRMVRQSEDAEDIVQETFVRMFRALDRYDPNRPFTSWLFTIASRLCIDHIRRRKSTPVSLVQMNDEGEERTIDVEDSGETPDVAAQHSEEEGRVQQLIDSLPPHYRIVVVLRHQQDLSYEEIAKVLELPLGTVKARIHRARALLAERMRGESGGTES
jgi:RNA polymerase sigma-70 factor (ECF subfamily)